jgi:hypothetical protein
MLNIMKRQEAFGVSILIYEAAHGHFVMVLIDMQFW